MLEKRLKVKKKTIQDDSCLKIKNSKAFNDGLKKRESSRRIKEFSSRSLQLRFNKTK